MTDLLPILTSIFVVYMLYEIVKTVVESDRAPVKTTVDISAPQATAPTEPPPAPAPAVKAPTAAEPAKILHLRNPETGEVSPVPGNTRFAKKWIKEAMVAEGLLNKVYKNSELTEAVSPKAKAAIEQFKQLEKYHV